MGKYAKHLSQDNYIELLGEKMYLKGLGAEYAEHQVRVSSFFAENLDMATQKKMQSLDPKKDKQEMEDLAKESFSNLLKNMNKDVIDSMTTLIIDTLKKSDPAEWEKDEDEVRQFGLKYMFELIMKILAINNPSYTKSSEDGRRDKALNRLHNATANKPVEPTTTTEKVE